MSTTPFHVPFPDDYPELLEQMGQVVGRELIESGMPAPQVISTTFRIVDAIRSEIGGVQQYIPRGHSFELSKRDAMIWAKFSGDNYS